MGYLPLFVALHHGFLKNENIGLKPPAMLPNIAHNALLSGDVEYHGVADSALRLAAKGAPVKSIFFSARLPNYFLMARPNIKSVAELRGKYSRSAASAARPSWPRASRCKPTASIRRKMWC